MRSVARLLSGFTTSGSCTLNRTGTLWVFFFKNFIGQLLHNGTRFVVIRRRVPRSQVRTKVGQLLTRNEVVLMLTHRVK